MIPVYKPSIGELEKKYVNDCLDSSWISSKGGYVSKFENDFARAVTSPHATSVCNGTVALHLALLSIGVGPGDEVIVPSFTYVASVNTILQIGAKPVFIDSLESTLQLNPADIERKISAKTKAIMAVHLYGLPCEMETIQTICDKHSLLLIEDCAEAFGTYYKGQHVGTFGDVATFSFFGNKTITTGEGGMVIARDEEVIGLARHLKNQGVSASKEYWHDQIAFNYRMTNICAAIGCAQLEKAEDVLKKKRQIATFYKEVLSGLPMRTHDEQPGTIHSYWMCSIILEDAQQRDGLRHHLKDFGIETRPFFYPVHILPHLNDGNSYPIAEKISQLGINLPSFPQLSIEELDYICEKIKAFYCE